MPTPTHNLPPSRYQNPFATCWTRPGAIAFQFDRGESAESLLTRFERANCRGEIVGPHGSGKSTLLETLRPHWIAAGWNVATITLRSGERRLPKEFLRRSLLPMRALVVVDGYEQLSPLSRAMLRIWCRWRAAGLLVATHTSVGLPLLYRTQPSRALAEQLVSTLTARISSPISAVDVAASHARCGSNLREMLFALYERHEALVAARHAEVRTSAIAVT